MTEGGGFGEASRRAPSCRVGSSPFLVMVVNLAHRVTGFIGGLHHATSPRHQSHAEDCLSFTTIYAGIVRKVSILYISLIPSRGVVTTPHPISNQLSYTLFLCHTSLNFISSHSIDPHKVCSGFLDLLTCFCANHRPGAPCCVPYLTSHEYHHVVPFTPARYRCHPLGLLLSWVLPVVNR